MSDLLFQKDSLLGALSLRELQILELISTGKDNVSISEDLGIVRSTLEHHINSIYQKLPSPYGFSPRITAALSFLKEIGKLKE